MTTTLTHPLAIERLADAARMNPFSVFHAAIAIATHARPTLKPQLIHEQLERYTRDVQHLLNHNNAHAPSLRHVLFDRYGYYGSRVQYHDPRNSYIDQVLSRRTGLPILLTLLYVETARRVGASAHGIGLPGHFVAALDLDGPSTPRLYVDCFNHGAVLSEDDCRRTAQATGTPWHEDFLKPLAPLPWTLRILSNLRQAYLEKNDLPNTIAVLEQMLFLDPANPARQAELQSLRTALDRHIARNN